MAKDEREAVKWYRKAADGGNADAMPNLGYMYEQGRGVPRDEAEAVKWYRKAADAGIAKARFARDLSVHVKLGRRRMPSNQDSPSLLYLLHT